MTEANLKSKTVIVEDQEVHFYEILGTQKELPTLVFLHGWRSEARAWFNALEGFIEKGFTMYLLDLPGFGKSENPRKPFTVSDYVEVVQAFLEKLNVSDIALIGHSVGGRIGIKYAATHPVILKRLVLTNSAGVQLSQDEISLKKKIAKIVKPFFKPSFMQPLRRKIYSYMGAEDYLARPEMKETFLNLINEDLEPYLSKISCPTLLVWGDKDMETPLLAGQKMERLIPDSRLVVFEDAGHFSFLDEPKKFGEEVVSFITHGTREENM